MGWSLNPQDRCDAMTFYAQASQPVLQAERDAGRRVALLGRSMGGMVAQEARIASRSGASSRPYFGGRPVAERVC